MLADISGAAGLYWLWDEHLNAGPETEGLRFCLLQCEQFDTELSALWAPNALCSVAITEGKWLMRRSNSETLHILGKAMDEAWRRVKFNHLNGSAFGARGGGPHPVSTGQVA